MNQHTEKLSEQQLKVYNQLQITPTIAATCRALGMKRSTVRTHIRRIEGKLGMPYPFAPVAVPEGMDMVKTTLHYKRNNKTGAFELANEWRRLTPNADAIERWVDKLCEGITPIKPEPVEPLTQDDQMNVLVLADAHLGLKCWAGETGRKEDWDLEKAKAAYWMSIADLIDRAPPAHTFTLFNLGDVTESNGRSHRTPRSGHTLDMSDPHNTATDASLELIVMALLYARRKFPHVRYEGVGGNHDIDVGWALSRMLEIYFRLHPDVDIGICDSTVREVVWGNCSWFLLHGENAPVARIKDAYSDTRSWCITRFRHIFTGHLHEKKVSTFHGCEHEQFGTPTARNKHAFDSCYGQHRHIIPLISYDKNMGEVGRLSSLVRGSKVYYLQPQHIK